MYESIPDFTLQPKVYYGFSKILALNLISTSKWPDDK